MKPAGLQQRKRLVTVPAPTCNFAAAPHIAAAHQRGPHPDAALALIFILALPLLIRAHEAVKATSQLHLQPCKHKGRGMRWSPGSKSLASTAGSCCHAFRATQPHDSQLDCSVPERCPGGQPACSLMWSWNTAISLGQPPHCRHHLYFTNTHSSNGPQGCASPCKHHQLRPWAQQAAHAALQVVVHEMRQLRCTVLPAGTSANSSPGTGAVPTLPTPHALDSPAG